MSMNSFGHLFRVTTWGESHGPALGATVDGCPPGVAIDEQMKGGITREVGMEIARRMVDEAGVDFLNVIRGHVDSDASLADVIPVQGMPSAPHLDFAGEVRAELEVPVFHAAKISDIATARGRSAMSSLQAASASSASGRRAGSLMARSSETARRRGRRRQAATARRSPAPASA